MTGVPKLLKTLRNPASSGVVSCVVPFPDCRHIARFTVPSTLGNSATDSNCSARQLTIFGCGTLQKHLAMTLRWPSRADLRRSRLYLVTMEVTYLKCVRWPTVPCIAVYTHLAVLSPVIDPGARFMVTASSNRGLHGESTRTVFVHDIKLTY